MSKNKRFIPVLYRDITEAEDKAKIHPAISAHNWIFCRDTDTYETSIKTLLEAINTDLEHNKTLKRLLVRAQEWEGNQKENSYALRGEDLHHAQDWLSTALNKTPAPLPLHLDYITFSQRLQQRQQRQRLALLTSGLIGSVILTVISIILGLLALEARNDAVGARNEAYLARDAAQVSEKRARAISLAANALQALISYKPDLALTLGLKAIEIDSDEPQVLAALAQAIYTPGTYRFASLPHLPTGVYYVGTTNTVMVGGDEGYLCQLEVPSFAPKACFTDPDSPDWSSMVIDTFSVDTAGRYMVTYQPTAVLFWDIAAGANQTPTALWRCDESSVDLCEITTAQITPDGTKVFMGSDTGELIVWDVKTQSVTQTLEGGELDGYDVSSIAFSSDSQYAIVVHNGNEAAFWSVDQNEQIGLFSSPDDEVITSAAISHNHEKLALGLHTGDIALFDSEDFGYLGNLVGHQGIVTDLTFADDDLELYSSSEDNTVGHWRVSSLDNLYWHSGDEGGLQGFTIDSTRTWLVTVANNSSIRLWRLKNELQPFYKDTQQPIQYFNYHDQTKLLVLANADGTIDLSHYTLGDADLQHDKTLPSDGYPIVKTQIARDGKTLYSLDDANTLSAWDVSTGDRLWDIDASSDNGATESIVLMPDNANILVQYTFGWALYGTQDHVRHTEVNYGRLIIQDSLAIDPDGKSMLIGTQEPDDPLILVDIMTGKDIRHYTGHRSAVTTTAFSSDGTRFASGSLDTDIIVWNTETGDIISTLSGHDSTVTRLRFLPDEKHLLSASDDQTIRLWDLDIQATLYRYTGLTDQITNMRTTADGLHFMTVNDTGIFAVWSLPPSLEDMIAWARENRYIRDLRCFERKLYLGEDVDCTLVHDNNLALQSSTGSSADAVEATSEAPYADATAEATTAP